MYQNRTFTVSAYNHCTDLKQQCFDKCLHIICGDSGNTMAIKHVATG